MNRTPFIASSLVLNLALLASLAWRPSLAPPGVRHFLGRLVQPAPASAPAPLAKPKPPPAAKPRLWTTLDTGDDLAGLVAKLRAAGFPAGIVRAIVGAELGARYDARMRALFEPDASTPFWKVRPNFPGSGDKRLEEMNRLQRERATLTHDLFQDPFFADDADITAAQRRQFGSLSRQKIDQVRRIEDDYAEMSSAIRAGMGGITLPEDREKLALLAREKRADLAAMLTPEELADYELRSSPITSRLRTILGGFDPNEAEFRAVFQAQKELNDKFPGGSALSADQQQRQAAQQAFHDQLQRDLGPARYADYLRETDREYQQLSRIALQQGVPAATAIQAYTLRDTLAQESGRIFDDAALNVDEKRAALQTLAQNTRNQILATLGPAAGPPYLKVADQWLNNVERGAAVSFSENRTMTIMSDSGMSTYGFGGGPTYRRLPTPTPGR